MTVTSRPTVDARRARRLRVLTRLTVVAWITALALSLVPVVVGGATGPDPSAKGAMNEPDTGKASPGPTASHASSTPGGNGDNKGARATQKPSPSRKPAASPKVTPTPRPTSDPRPTSTPRSSPKPVASGAATPRPERSHKPGPSHGGGGNPNATPSSQGGSPRGTGGSGNTTPGTTNRPSAGAAAAPSASAGVALTVPGPFARGAPDDPFRGGGAEDGLEGEIYLDFDLAGTLEVFTPAALLALPGLLILASLAAQIAGGILWIPLTHRLLGGRSRTTPRTRRRG